MKTATRKVETNSSIDANHVLLEQAEIQRKALAESGLYRAILANAAKGLASNEQIQAAKVLANKWRWSFDADLKVLTELAGYETKYPDGFQVASQQTWNDLTAQATKCREHDEQAKKIAYELEVERRRLEKENTRCNQWSERPAVIRREHPHLFDANE